MFDTQLNLYKPNTCLFQKYKLVPKRYGLDRFHCLFQNKIQLNVIFQNFLKFQRIQYSRVNVIIVYPHCQ
jgi:hypothetical protein